MDLRQLRYFVTVAEELHFSRAAARLHLAQSALSAQVRHLEDELGGPLLVRTTRRVTLTPAGQALFEDGRAILTAVDEAAARARALARGEGEPLSVGSLGPVPGGLLPALLGEFRARHANVPVTVRALDFNDPVSGLREGKAHAAFLYEPVSDPELLVTPLMAEPRVVVMPRGHRLARFETLRPADLEGEVFVAQPSSMPPEWHDFWMLVDELGHRPAVSPYVGENIEEWLQLIGRGEGIDTCPAVIARYFAWPELAFVPLADAAPATLVLARPRGPVQPLVEEFVALAAEVAGAAALRA